jgi:hypothetical protein
MEKGSPTIISSTLFLVIISIIDRMSASISRRVIMVSGVAMMPRGSLNARPMRASPTSSARILEILTSAAGNFSVYGL